MSTVQGLHIRVNLNNGDVFFGIATQVDDDGSISLEQARRCFTSGRVAEYAFMKVPGHIVLDYHPTANEQASIVETRQPTQYQEPPPRPPPPAPSPTPPPPLTSLNSTEATTDHLPPVAQDNSSSSTSLEKSPIQYPQACLSPNSNGKNTFIDPAIISISSTEAQEKKSSSEKRSNKRQSKSGKGKKGADTDSLEPTAATAAASTSTAKPQKSKRGSKNKQQQQNTTGGPLGEKGDGSVKSVKSPPKSKNAKKQSSKKQQSLPQQQQIEQEPEQPQIKKQQPPIQQHVMPQFGSKTAPRKLVDTVVYDDFDDFIDTATGNQGYSISTNKESSANKHRSNQSQDEPQVSPSHAVPETSAPPSQLHKPDDAVNQVATQSLLSSLNMIPTAAFAKSLSGSSPPSSSSVTSDRSHTPHQYQSPSSILVDKTNTANQGFKMSFPMPKPIVYTGYNNDNGASNRLQQETDHSDEKGTTPTKTLVPVLPTMESTSSHSSPPVERLQKPMEHENTVPIITNGNSSHANSYDGPVIKSVATGVACPVLSTQLLSRLIQITKSETGLTDSMLIENAAHAATSITFKVIGGQRRVQQQNHNDAPIVVILAGNHSVGNYGIATARHLANRGIQVVVLLASVELDAQVKEQKRCAQFAGVTFVDGVDELPDPLTAPVDLIIDALMGSVISMVDLKKNQMDRTLLWQGIDWANGNKAPVLSMDYPSGVNSEYGHPFHVMHYILPKWTLCFGAPIQGCVSDKVTGGLFVADLGIPAVSWQRIGIKKRGLPWGTESVMPLEYE